MKKRKAVVSVTFDKQLTAVDIYCPSCPYDDPCCCTERGKCGDFHGLETIEYMPFATCDAPPERKTNRERKQ